MILLGDLERVRGDAIVGAGAGAGAAAGARLVLILRGDFDLVRRGAGAETRVVADLRRTMVLLGAFERVRRDAGAGAVVDARVVTIAMHVPTRRHQLQAPIVRFDYYSSVRLSSLLQ